MYSALGKATKLSCEALWKKTTVRAEAHSLFSKGKLSLFFWGTPVRPREGEGCKENIAYVGILSAGSEKGRRVVMQYSAASNFQPGWERLNTVLSVGFRMQLLQGVVIWSPKRVFPWGAWSLAKRVRCVWLGLLQSLVIYCPVFGLGSTWSPGSCSHEVLIFLKKERIPSQSWNLSIAFDT